MQQHRILQPGPSVSFTQSSLYRDQNAPKCIKSERICRQKVANSAQNPLLSFEVMHAYCGKGLHLSKDNMKRTFTSSSEMNLPNKIHKYFCYSLSSDLLGQLCIERSGGMCTKSPSNPLPRDFHWIKLFSSWTGQKTRIQKSYNFAHLDPTFTGRDGIRSDCFRGGSKTAFQHLVGKGGRTIR